MKRVNDEGAPAARSKKRVRFDPETKDNSADDKPSVPKTPIRPLKRGRKEDDLDILGRRVGQEGSSNLMDANNGGVEVKDKKHTLDSDEEDDIHEPKQLDLKSVQGQEKATIEYEGSIKIMPFNMQEEEEEGHYDEEGNFVFNKNKDEVHDEWADNIDWDSAKLKAGNHWNKTDDEDNDAAQVDIDGVAACERILRYLDDKALVSKENSTVNDVLKKLNSQKNLSAAEERKRRWAAKKDGKEYKNEFSESANELTGAVDDLVSLGHMEAYSMTRQQISDLYEKLEVAKELAERAERKRLADAVVNKPETTESLINDLMSDEEEMDTDEPKQRNSADGDAAINT